MNAIVSAAKPEASLLSATGMRPHNVVPRRVVTWEGIRVKMMTCSLAERFELRIDVPHHTVIQRCDGVTTGAEWHDGEQRPAMTAIRPGNVCFVAAGHAVVWAMRVVRPIRFMCVELNAEAVASLIRCSDAGPNPRFRSVPLLDSHEVRHTLYAIRNEIDRPGPLDALYRQGLTALLTLQLARVASDLADARPRLAGTSGLPGWRLRRALDLLEADLETPPSLESLARQVGLSPSHFSHAFKQSMGLPPHQYVIQRRVAEAKALMANRKLNLTEIALQCGFNGSSQFSTVFRRATGMSPSAYRHEL